jgi:hypothetical protein
MAEAEAARISEQEAARQARAAQQEATRKAQQEARRLEIAKEEAAKTLQHIVLDFTLVTFGAGLAIQRILTGFESCRIRIKGLPLDATYNEVCTLFTQQGMDPEQFHVIGMTKTSNGKQEADVVCQEDLKVIAIGLDGIQFRQEMLQFEVYQNGTAEGMKASVGSHADVLTISWRAPSTSFVVTYLDDHQAEAKVRELDRKICAGRRVKVEINRPPAGHPLKHSSANAISIRGLPSSITDDVVREFSGSTLLRRLKATQYDIARAPEYIRHQIDTMVPGRLQLFETVTIDAVDGVCIVRAHFDSRDQAKLVYNALDKRQFWFIGNTTLWLRLPDPLHYTISIPIHQYLAQKKRWDSLKDGIKDKDECNLSVNARDRVCIIRIGGENKKAVGSIKVRVENLAAGEKLEHWHQLLGAGHGGQRFLDSVFKATGAFIRCDWRHRALKAYGEPTNVDAARVMVQSEIERLESLEQTVFLKRQSVGFFMRQGLAVLEEDLGKDNVTLDISSSPCKIIIRGGESARHTLRRVIDQSLDQLNIETETRPDANCPICYDEISAPVQLACGHCYCTACIRHFLVTSPDTKIFPLCCMGDENNCRVPIPIPTLQRFLPPQQFNHLLEVVFVTHIERFPQEFKYCKTPDCSQVYRADNSLALSVLHCPSCLSTVCSSCHEEAHAGMSCAERKLHSNPAEQERLNDQLAMRSGFKKCPTCKVWIEKTEGCNHMSCKCGAHICWVCMNTFTLATIYEHMNEAHGGYNVDAGNQYGARGQLHEEADDDLQENYAVQVELLRQAAQFRERHQEQLQRAERIRRFQIQQEIQEDIRRRDIARYQAELTREAETRRQELRQAQLRRQEAHIQAAQQDNGWGCVIM